MTDEDRWQRWFHDRHPMPELARWACGLRYFRFRRAVGGHSGVDDDSFLAALRYDGEADLLALLGALGIAPVRLPPGVPQAVPGQRYTGDERAAFPSLVSAHPTVQQPGHVRLAGQAAFVWAAGDRLTLSVNDEADRWNVSEAAFEAAGRIEAVLGPLAERVVDPPWNDRHCLCPAVYPHVFAACS